MRIEILSYKSLFIEMYFQGTLLSSATATLIARDHDSPCILVTARHNVTGRHQDTNVCLHSHASTPDHVVIHLHGNQDPENMEAELVKIKLPLFRSDGSPYWIEHPILGAKADIVALNINWGKDVSKIPYYLGTELDKSNMMIGPADNVSIIGFPFGLSNRGKFPIWSTGFVAQELDLVTSQDPVFLVDGRTRQGQSGSPVVAFRPYVYRCWENGKVVAKLTTNEAWEFLGIYSGRVNTESDLGKVWHVSAVSELFDAAAMQVS